MGALSHLRGLGLLLRFYLAHVPRTLRRLPPWLRNPVGARPPARRHVAQTQTKPHSSSPCEQLLALPHSRRRALSGRIRLPRSRAIPGFPYPSTPPPPPSAASASGAPLPK